MKPSPTTSFGHFQDHLVPVTYQIAGFDRINFVSDITNTVPQDGLYTIRALHFESDGLQAHGLLTVRMREVHRLAGSLIQRLRSVQGIVSIREV
ncbi:ACT domain-containing protein [Spirosoma koreense]